MSNSFHLALPAGNLEKARIAFAYGADAVFVGGTVFGLRKYADNFSLTELEILINEAHSQKKSVYVVLNAFAHNSDIHEIHAYIDELNAIKPDAVIVSDLGVAHYVQKHSSLNLHISTQASVAHATSCEAWKTLGAKRAILAPPHRLGPPQSAIQNTLCRLVCRNHACSN